MLDAERLMWYNQTTDILDIVKGHFRGIRRLYSAYSG